MITLTRSGYGLMKRTSVDALKNMTVRKLPVTTVCFLADAHEIIPPCLPVFFKQLLRNFELARSFFLRAEHFNDYELTVPTAGRENVAVCAVTAIGDIGIHGEMDIDTVYT